MQNLWKKNFKSSLKLITVLLFFCIIFSNTVMTYGQEAPVENPSFTLGDINGGGITVGDAILVLREIVGLGNLKEEDLNSWQRGDVNLDGFYTLSDALTILRYIVGLAEEFEPVDSPVVYTVEALKYVISETERESVNLARDMDLQSCLEINRAIAIKGLREETRTVISGEIKVASLVESFTLENIELEALTINGGGTETVNLFNTAVGLLIVNGEVSIAINIALYPASEIEEAVFKSDATVSGGKNIKNAFIKAGVNVDFGDDAEDYPENIFYEAIALEMVEEPSDTLAGIVIEPAPAVQVVDEFGNPVADGGLDVTVSLSEGSLASGTLTVATDAVGIAVFDDLVIITAGTDYKLTFTSVDLDPAESVLFDIMPFVASEILVGGDIPDEVNFREVLNIPVLTITDEFGNAIDGENVTLLAARLDEDGNPEEDEEGSVILYEFDAGTVQKVTDVDGNVTFDNLAINKAGDYLITFVFDHTDPEDPPLKFRIAVIPYSIDYLSGSPPVTITAGQVIADIPGMLVTDRHGEIIEGETISVIATPLDAEGDLILDEEGEIIFYSFNDGTLQKDSDLSGYVEFTDLVINKAGLFLISFVFDGFSFDYDPLTFPINILPADAASLSLTEQPSDTVAGVVIEPAPSVQVVDEFGNPLTDEDLEITATLEAGEFSAGTLTVATDESGKASFTDLIISEAGEYRIIFSCETPLLESTTTDLFEIYNQYNISFAVNPEGTGTALVSSEEGPFRAGEIINIRAVASYGYRFKSWYSTAGSIENPVISLTTFTMPDEDVIITAEFVYATFFQVYPLANDITGQRWALNSPITVTVNDRIYDDIYTGQGTFLAGDFRSDNVEISPGELVTVSDGTITKSHLVRDIEVLELDHEADTIKIRTDTAGLLKVFVETGLGLIVRTFEAVANEDITVDFSVHGANEGEEPFDIGIGTAGYIQQSDAEGDTTQVNWRVPDPYIVYDFTKKTVWGYDWLLSENVTITVDDIAGNPLETFSSSDSEDWGPDKWGTFSFKLPESLEISECFTVKVSDGKFFEQTHEIIGIRVEEINGEDETIAGETSLAGELEVYLYRDLGLIKRTTTAEAEENKWSVSFSEDPESNGENVIGPGDHGYVIQYDTNGNGTRFDWQIYEPVIYINLSDNAISGVFWPPREPLTISTYNIAGEEAFNETITATSAGTFNLNLSDYPLYAGYIISPGENIKVSAENYFPYNIDYDVRNISVTQIDFAENRVYGTAANSEERIMVNLYDGVEFHSVEAVFTDAVNWYALFAEAENFSAAKGFITQSDAEGNATQINWGALSPFISVEPDNNFLWGFGWPSEEEYIITVAREGSSDIGPISGNLTNETGLLFFDFAAIAGLIIKPEDIVTVTSGDYTKSHRVIDLVISETDMDNNIIEGTTSSESQLQVAAYINGQPEIITPEMITLGDGLWGWTADFTGLGIDLTYGSKGFLLQQDNDGDTTRLAWRILDPVITVDLTNNAVWGHDWSPGEEVTITIYDEEGGAVIFGPRSSSETDNESVDGWGNFIYALGVDFTVKSGNQITVSAGAYSKSHTVKKLVVTGLSLDTDTVFGLAEPGSFVNVTCLTEPAPVTIADIPVNAAGEWEAVFPEGTLQGESQGFVVTQDDNSNTTRVEWRYHDNRIIIETGYLNKIHGEGWPGDAPVEISVNVSEKKWETVTDRFGTFEIEIDSDEFFIEPGQEFTVSAGVYEKNYTVKNITITEIDRVGQKLSGTAEDTENPVNIFVYISEETQVAKFAVFEGATNNWSASFDPEIIIPGTSGYVEQEDSAGNLTRIYWNIPLPNINIIPDGGSFHIVGADWLPGDIEITVINGVDVEVYTLVANENGFFFEHIEGFEMQPGFLVTATDNFSEKSHQLRYIEIEEPLLQITDDGKIEAVTFRVENLDDIVRVFLLDADSGVLFAEDEGDEGFSYEEDNGYYIITFLVDTAIYEYFSSGDPENETVLILAMLLDDEWDSTIAFYGNPAYFSEAKLSH